MLNRRTLTAGLSAALAGVSKFAVAQTPRMPSSLAVLELFTSQGCSSCPAADVVLAELAERPDVLALSFNVDYWDHLGWKDTLANPKSAKRQRYYAKARGDGQVYTPQAIVNGVGHIVGSDRSRIERAIAESASSARVSLSIQRSGDQLLIDVGAGPGAGSEWTLWLGFIARRREVMVKRGENVGRTLTYTNVVRDATAVGVWTGAPLAVRIDPRSAMPSDADTVAAILQLGMSGPIIGGAKLTVTS
jgi:hypothetical protein